MCYMTETADLMEELRKVATESDRQRAQASARLLKAVGEAAEQGLTQVQIARSIGRSQPEVSRLIRTYRAANSGQDPALADCSSNIGTRS